MKEKKYLVLYYLSFVLTLIFSGFASYKYMELLSIGDYNFSGLISEMFGSITLIINLALVVMFTILVIRKEKIQVDNNKFPIIYICFWTIVVVLCFIFNNKVMVPYLHFKYYSTIINAGFLFLNGYSLLLIKQKK